MAQSRTGYIMQSQNYSINDGEGIRTTIFLAGCPLRCQWCANPEGFQCTTQTAFLVDNCTACGACAASCAEGIGIDLNEPANRARCTGCGTCAHVCSSHARKQMVSVRTVEELIFNVKRQMIYYRFSGGGVTFSGGEAFTQQAFLRTLSTELYDMSVNLAVETCGYFDFGSVSDIVEKMSMVFVDIKHMDSQKHKTFTGMGNEGILENIRHIAGMKIPLVIRVPVIGGLNDDDTALRATGTFITRHAPQAKLELLPYHKLGLYKYDALGIPERKHEFSVPNEARMGYLRELLTDMGVQLVEYC